MRVNLNGKPAEVRGDGLTEVLTQLGIDEPRGIAIAIDGEVVPKSEWNDVILTEGQKVEVVRAVQGGSE